MIFNEPILSLVPTPHGPESFQKRLLYKGMLKSLTFFLERTTLKFTLLYWLWLLDFIHYLFIYL